MTNNELDRQNAEIDNEIQNIVSNNFQAKKVDNDKVLASAMSHFEDVIQRSKERSQATEEFKKVEERNLKPYKQEKEKEIRKKKVANIGKIVAGTVLAASLLLVGVHGAVRDSSKVHSSIPVGKEINTQANDLDVAEFYDDYFSKKLNNGDVVKALKGDLNIVGRHTKMTDRDYNYWYDCYEIAREIMNSEVNPHINIYAAYYNFFYNKEEHINELIHELHIMSDEGTYFSDVETFDNYLSKLGIESRDDYNKIMKQIISLSMDPEMQEEYKQTLSQLTYVNTTRDEEPYFKNNESVRR